MKNSKAISMAALALGGLFAPMMAQADLAPKADGYLEVFSATRQMQWGDGTYFYPRTGYVVYGTDGCVVRQVDNQTSVTSSEPEQVELAPGTYTVWAESDAGYFRQRVTIKPAQITEVRP